MTDTFIAEGQSLFTQIQVRTKPFGVLATSSDALVVSVWLMASNLSAPLSLGNSIQNPTEISLDLDTLIPWDEDNTGANFEHVQTAGIKDVSAGNTASLFYVFLMVKASGDNYPYQIYERKFQVTSRRSA